MLVLRDRIATDAATYVGSYGAAAGGRLYVTKAMSATCTRCVPISRNSVAEGRVRRTGATLKRNCAACIRGIGDRVKEPAPT